ncbi:hypothetical protein AAC387_Pa05g2347 [Persea americana]
MEAGESTPKVEKTSQTPVAKKNGRHSVRKPKTSLPTRFTRSQVVPDWTIEEMLVLVNEVATINEGSLKSLSTYQRWKMISDNCMALGVFRSSNLCRRKWETMLAEYKKIKEWESQSGAGSYWCLESERKKEYGLPAFFDRELFGSIYGFLKAQETQPDSDMDSESEGLIRKMKTALHDVTMDLGPNSSTRSKACRSRAVKAQEIVRKLQESAQLMHAILRGELSETAGGNGTHSSTDVNEPNHQTQFVRRQGDELIKVFGTLIVNLNQLVELVKENGLSLKRNP